MTDLPLDSGKTLEPVSKSEKDVKKGTHVSPEVDKTFFSFFTLSSYHIPMGTQKPSIDLDEEMEK